jgi:putative PIN family toxin of toxin-antitoxin system
MRVLVDSNVLFSAVYAKNSVPHQAFNKAVEPPYQCLICQQSFEELRRAFNRKFPDMVGALEQFITYVLPVVEVVSVPNSFHPYEDKIRDVDDRPILRAAIKAGANIIITGDLDFLESSIKEPKIMTAAQFIQYQTQ